MTLREICEDAWACGLSTVEEAIRNYYIHASNFLPYDRMQDEMEELQMELDKIQPNMQDSVSKYCDVEKLARQMEDFYRGYSKLEEPSDH